MKSDRLSRRSWSICRERKDLFMVCGGIWLDFAGFGGHGGERKWGYLVLECGIGVLDVLKTGFCDIVRISRWNNSFCCDMPILITDHHVSNSFLFPDYTGGVG